MIYTSKYFSPLGAITIACDEDAIIGLWFDGQKHFGYTLTGEIETKSHPLLEEAGRWLDVYFPVRSRIFFHHCDMDLQDFANWFATLC